MIPFTKMQGAGNDYVYVEGMPVPEGDLPELARRMSDRHFGIGSDGLVLILPSEVADLRMRMLNADGTEAEMCGNASRCVGLYACRHGLVAGPDLTLETGAGIKTLHVQPDEGRVCVHMGTPTVERVDEEIDLWPGRMTCVSMGNPHAVCFVDDVASLDLPRLGPAFEHHPRFPQRTNTEFVQVLGPARVRMRVWERGAGETLACGTGCCATAVACALSGRTGRSVAVEVLGGELDIDWREADGCVYMTGPAVTVFGGEYPYTF